MTVLLLLAAGFVGGCLNSLAGGGSFVVFPALILAGVPPVLANASNTYAALPGYFSGFVGFRRHMSGQRSRLLLYSVIALIGGWAGAELLLRVSDADFERVVPWLILFAVALFAFGGAINRWVALKSQGSVGLRRAGIVLILVIMLLVCIYGGFFNAGLGILLLAVLALAGLTDIHAMNGLKMWVAGVVALVAVGRFAIGGSIAWYEGSIALVGVTAGSYLAARFAHHVPTPIIRAIVIVYGLGLTAYFFWKSYSGA